MSIKRNNHRVPRTKARRLVLKWKPPKFLKHRTNKEHPATRIFPKHGGTLKLLKGPLSISQLATRKKNQLKAAWLGLKLRRQRAANKAVGVLRSTRTRWLDSRLHPGNEQYPDFSCVWCFNQCLGRICDEIHWAYAEMEALAIRSSNVQGRTRQGRAFATDKAAEDKQTKVSMEQNIAPPQADWEVMPTPNEIAPLLKKYQAKPRTSSERAFETAFAARKAAADRESDLLKDKNFALPPPELVIQPPQNGDILSETYKTGARIGRGGFAICYKGVLQPRGGRPPETYALKIVRAEMADGKLADKFRTELQIHAKMHHPNIVEFHRAFTFKESTYVVLELCSSGSVMDMVKHRKCLSLPEVRRFIMQLCGAVKYMHARDVIHRDLKMGNLFLDESMNLKVGDFGLAAVLESTYDRDSLEKGAPSRRNTLCGTPNYIAPEVLEKGRGGHDHKVDIWAIGVIFYAMITGKPPFQAMTQKEIYRKAKKADYSWLDNAECQNDIPDEAKSIVAQLLVIDAEARPDLDEIVCHPFFRMRGGMNIPRKIEYSCMKEKPHWLSNNSPRGDVFAPNTARWHWESFAQICGVGRLPGAAQSIPPTGGDIGVSVYRLCVVEVEESLGPEVPLPTGTVYPSEKISTTAPAWQPSTSRSSLSDVSIAETETSVPIPQVTIENSYPMKAPPRKRKPVQSHAAGLRASNAPSRRSQTRQRPAPGPSAAQTQDSASIKSTSSRGSTSSAMRIELGSAPIQPTASGGRTTRSKSAEQASQLPDRPIDPPVLDIDQYVDHEYSDPGKVRREKAVQTEVRIASAVQREMNKPLETGIGSSAQSSLPDQPGHVQSAEVLGNRLISLDEAPECLPNSKPDEVLSKLSIFHGELTRSINETQLHNRSRSTSSRKKNTEDRPVVLKWVDYTNKFGIGYMLQNGTVGCVFKEDEYLPVTCVVVAGADRHFKLRKIGSYAEKHQIVPEHGASVEFLENCGQEGINRICVAPTDYRIETGVNGLPEKFKISGETCHDSWKRQKLQLWEKFGQYMTKSLGISDNEEVIALLVDEAKVSGKGKGKAKYEAGGPLVKFYQRLGNIGIWGFDTGSFQFNFPDHTKLVISDDGAWVDFYHLSVNTARALKEGGTLGAGGLGERGAFTYPMDIMLRGVYKDHDFRDLVEANELMKKVTFIRDLVKIWVDCGGLGRLGEHKWMKWEGMQEPGGKLGWTSVGALGGDDKWELPEVMTD